MRLCGEGLLLQLSCLLANRAVVTVLFSEIIQPVQGKVNQR